MTEEGSIPSHSFCEPAHVTGARNWCIRKIPDGEGLKVSGGVTTDSLCGRVKSPSGWDMRVEITPRLLDSCCCRKCRKIYEEFQ